MLGGPCCRFRRWTIPFAGYENFAACVKANAKKNDPKAYCASVMRAVEKAEVTDVTMVKAGKTKTVSGQELSASDFAYVGDAEDPETWKLPVHDAAHARNALARFNQTEGIPAGEKAKVHAKIAAAAKKHGVEVSSDTQKSFTILKIDEPQRLVFGWASVAGIEDLQGDVMEVDELEPAVYDFVLKSRVGTDLHNTPVRGQLIESFVLTPEKLEKMGLSNISGPEAAWFVGFKFDAETFAKVQAGDRTMFSIKGEAIREPIGG